MASSRLGLRLRVALTLALTCLLVVGALGFTLFEASEELEEGLIDQLVIEEMDFLMQRHRGNPDYQPQQGSNLQSFIVRNAGDQRRLPTYLLGLERGRHEFFVGQDEFHVLVREVAGIRYLVAYEVGLHEQREADFKTLVLLSVLIAAVASLAVGYWLSGLLVHQVTDLAARVAVLKPGQRAEGLVRPGQDVEVAMLAGAFEKYQSRIEQMIRREQEFTSNASHELRTPLTAIRTSCELLLADPALDEKARTRLERINAASARMTEQIQALLFLARGEGLGDVEPVVLADCVAEAVEPYRAEIESKGLALEVTVPPQVQLKLNYQALRMVLANLVRNAVHYTERGFVRITYSDGRLTVADSGRGIAVEHQARVFDRFFRADDGGAGIGLGLAIVKRICDQYGWKIGIESIPAQGSVFSIVFA